MSKVANESQNGLSNQSNPMDGFSHIQLAKEFVKANPTLSVSQEFNQLLSAKYSQSGFKKLIQSAVLINMISFTLDELNQAA